MPSLTFSYCFRRRGQGRDNREEGPPNPTSESVICERRVKCLQIAGDRPIQLQCPAEKEQEILLQLLVPVIKLAKLTDFLLRHLAYVICDAWEKKVVL